MRKASLVLVFATLALASTEARADGLFSLDAVYLDVRGHFPVNGDFRDFAGFPIGVDGEIQLDLFHNAELWLQGGIMYGLAGDATVLYLPFMAGLAYNLNEGSKTPFFGAGFGANITYASFNDASDTSINPTLDLHAGYNMGSIRVKAGYQILDLEFVGDTSTLYAAIGFNLR